MYNTTGVSASAAAPGGSTAHRNAVTDNEHTTVNTGSLWPRSQGGPVLPPATFATTMSFGAAPNTSAACADDDDDSEREERPPASTVVANTYAVDALTHSRRLPGRSPTSTASSTAVATAGDDASAAVRTKYAH